MSGEGLRRNRNICLFRANDFIDQNPLHRSKCVLKQNPSVLIVFCNFIRPEGDMSENKKQSTLDIKALEEEVRTYELRARLSEAKLRIAEADTKRRSMRKPDDRSQD
jgi:hypothetical protein